MSWWRSKTAAFLPALVALILGQKNFGLSRSLDWLKKAVVQCRAWAKIALAKINDWQNPGLPWWQNTAAFLIAFMLFLGLKVVGHNCTLDRLKEFADKDRAIAKITLAKINDWQKPGLPWWQKLAAVMLVLVFFFGGIIFLTNPPIQGIFDGLPLPVFIIITAYLVYSLFPRMIRKNAPAWPLVILLLIAIAIVSLLNIINIRIFLEYGFAAMLNANLQNDQWILRIIGAIGCIALHILLWKVDRSSKPAPVGHIAYVSTLWLFGMIIHWRTAMPFSQYYDAVLTSATIFILILSFRTNRLARLAGYEDGLIFRLQDKIRATKFVGGAEDVINRLQLIRYIDLLSSEKSDGGIKVLAKLREILDKTIRATENSAEREKLSQLQSDAASLVHSKLQGNYYSEIVALWILGLATIFCLLFFLPNEQAKMSPEPLSGFFMEMAAMLIAATIVLLLFNIMDLQKDRSDPTLISVDVSPLKRKNEVTAETVNDSFDDELNIFQLKDSPNRDKVQGMVVFLFILITASYAILFWNDWFSPNLGCCP